MDATRVVAPAGVVATPKRQLPAIPPRIVRALLIGAPLALGAIAAAFAGARWLGSGSDDEEPRRLGPEPIAASFGVGEGVDFAAPQGKMFEFELFSPVRTVGVLRMATRGELVLRLNGREAGRVPEGDVEWVFHPEQLVRGGGNSVEVVPATSGGAWRISGARVELIPLPEDEPELLAQEAAVHFARAAAAQEHRALGAENLALAWDEYKSAWLLLESHPPARPALHEDARQRMRIAERELERLCAQKVLKVQALRAADDAAGARSAIADGARYFPGEAASKCPALTRSDVSAAAR